MTKCEIRSFNKAIFVIFLLFLPSITFILANESIFDENNNMIGETDSTSDLTPNLISQMNQVPIQLSMDYVWNTMNLTGDSNASIAILGTGIDATHLNFGSNAYGEKNFSRKIIGWNDSIGDENNPIDPNGQGTFISSAAFGINSSNPPLPLDSQGRISATLGDRYYHPNLFDNWSIQGTFFLKLGSINIDSTYSNITVKGKYDEIGENFIQKANISLYKDGILINETDSAINGIYDSFNHNITWDLGIYDIIFKYQVGFINPVNFSVNALINFTLEEPIVGMNDLSGFAPDTKIYASRVLNESKNGLISDLIDALEWINETSDEFHIVAIIITLGSYLEDEPVNNVGLIIDSLIEKGIMVIIAAGDNGIKGDALNPIAQNNKAIIVGSVNELNKLTYYSSKGQEIDIVTAGGSLLNGYRGIISADSNTNDSAGFYPDQVINDTTIMSGTSISAGIVAAAYNMLVEAMGGYDSWKNNTNEQLALTLKSYLLMTATETNMLREDDPKTSIIDESTDSPVLNRGEEDNHEGFGLMNIRAAIEAITKSLVVDAILQDALTSSISDPEEIHSIARKVVLEKNEVYQFDLQYNRFGGDLDVYLYHNVSDSFGNPILLASTNDGFIEYSGFQRTETFYYGTINDTREYILVVKSIDGDEINFELDFTKKSNIYKPILEGAKVQSTQGFNDTLDTFEFSVNYTDLDNIPPIYMYLNIIDLEENITMEKFDQNDFNFSDSCNYTAEFQFYSPGVYEYYFWVFDGKNSSRFPEIDNLTLIVNPISSAKYNNYDTDFSNTSKWLIGDGWSNLTQSSSVDSRGFEFGANWSMLYFGNNNSASTGLYDYNSLTSSGEFMSYSPLFWVDNSLDVTLQLGMRISINTGDAFYVDVQKNRTGSWINLETFDDLEQDWSHYNYNLSKYSDNFIQIRFRTVIDLNDDIQKNKGIIISKFAVLHDFVYTNDEIKVFNLSSSPNNGYKYMNFQFSAIIGQQNGLTPENVLIEIGGINHTMINIYGDWNGTYIESNGILTNGGILFIYKTSLGNISDLSYRIHAYNGSRWFSSNITEGPELNSFIYTGYPFNNNNSQMSVYGTPHPESWTLWNTPTDSFHFFNGENVWYVGESDFLGYGENWDINLVLPIIQLPSNSEENHTLYLWFDHKLILDNGTSENDYGRVFISTNEGNSWILLTEFSESFNEFETIKLNLNNYGGEDILIKFSFQSDDSSTDLLESGWYIRNIFVKIDESEDITAPVITILNLSQVSTISGNFSIIFNVSDDFGLDYDEISVYLGVYELTDVNYTIYDNGTTFIYIFDSKQFNNGVHMITIICEDLSGHMTSETIEINIYNFKVSWDIIWTISIISFIGIVSSIVYLKRNSDESMKKFLIALLQGNGDLPDDRLNRRDKRSLKRARKNYLEMRIREELESVTSVSEADKSFTYRCKNCNNWFINKDIEWTCPNCKEDTLYIALKCRICDKWYYKDESGEFNCKKCKVKLVK